MFEVVEDLVERGGDLLIIIIGVLVIFSVIQTFIRTRSWVPTIGVLLVGAIALWGASNVDGISDAVEDDINLDTRGGAATGDD